MKTNTEPKLPAEVAEAALTLTSYQFQFTTLVYELREYLIEKLGNDVFFNEEFEYEKRFREFDYSCRDIIANTLTEIISDYSEREAEHFAIAPAGEIIATSKKEGDVA